MHLLRLDDYLLLEIAEWVVNRQGWKSERRSRKGARRRNLNAFVRTNRRLFSVCNYLLYRVDPNDALYRSTLRDNARAAQLALSNGATLEGKASSGGYNTALQYALQSHSHAIAIMLLRRGAGEFELQGPLHSASHWGLPKLAKWLLRQGVEIDEKDKDGNTPLLLAVLGASKDPEYRSVNWETKRHFEYYKVQRILLKGGANPDAANNSGKTPRIALKRNTLGLDPWRGLVK